MSCVHIYSDLVTDEMIPVSDQGLANIYFQT